MFSKDHLPSLLIRIGLAFVFTYAAISGFMHPETYLFYMPSFLRETPYAELILHVFGIYEILLSLWLLSGKLRRYAALLATITIFAITFANLASFQVVFRNIAIFFSSLALTFLDWEKATITNSPLQTQQTPPIQQTS